MPIMGVNSYGGECVLKGGMPCALQGAGKMMDDGQLRARPATQLSHVY